jgi:hypothetical protein
MHAKPGKLYDHEGLPVILVCVFKKRSQWTKKDCSVRYLAGKHKNDMPYQVLLKDLKRIKRSDLVLYIHLEDKLPLFDKKLRGE